MSAAARPLLLVVALATAGCGGSPQQPAEANNTAVVSEVEQLPPDESSATTSGELANGATETPPDPMAGNTGSP